jgi:hypothetical protein
VNAERIARMLEWAWSFDLEGHKIQPGLLAPPVVCASVAHWSKKNGRSEGRLLSLDEARVVFMRFLDDERVTICGANIAYDMLCMAVDFAARGVDVMPKILAAYEVGRVWDVQIAEALHAVARGHLGLDPRTLKKLRDPITRKLGRYSLSICLDLVLHRVDAKVNDKYRMSYALLEDTPIAEWPLEARVYPVDDACNTLDVALAQAGLIARPSDHVWVEVLDAPCQACGCALTESSDRACPDRCWQSLNAHDLAAQCRAAFAMHLGAAWGFCVDGEAVEELAERTTASRAAAVDAFVASGYLREEHDSARAKEVLARAGMNPRWFRKKDTGLNLPAADRAAMLQVLREGGAVEKVVKCTGVLKRSVALAYGATGACATCAGVGKVPSAKSGNPVGCRMCDSTGLDLDSAPVPRTKGSKCRTCGGERRYSTASKSRPDGPAVDCAQCVGQPDVVPGCATGRDALYESGDDDVLVPFAEYLLKAKILETYIPYLRKGMTEDGEVEADFDQDDAEDGGDE